jgi:Cys-tRNA(Pro)/Cys-tRNA(Cys) deacylase
MTPAINAAKKAKIDFQTHQYEHDVNAESYGLEASEKLGIPAEQVFKTLLAEVDKQLVVAVLPVSSQLNLKRCAAVFKGKKAVMANPQDAERATGYVVGGISPLGQKKRLKMVVDVSANDFDSIFVSAGRRGLEIELAAKDLAKLTGAVFDEVCA